MVGQALFTWASHLPGGDQGYGFVALSPSLRANQRWLEAASRSITNFVGGNQVGITNEERQSYLPLGRHVQSGKSLAYRKADAGRDGHGRPGRYLVHLLVATAPDLTLSDVLGLSPSVWIHAKDALIDRKVDLRDRSLADLRSDRFGWDNLGPVDVSRITNAITTLAKTGVLEVTDWNGIDLLNLLGSAPAWVDVNARLVPEWTSRGPAMHIVLGDEVYGRQEAEDHRIVPTDDELRSVRSMVSNCAARADLLAVMDRRFDFVGFGSAGERDGSSRLERVVERWAENGSSGLSVDDRSLLECDAVESLTALDRLSKRLPFSRKPDEIALTILADGQNRVDPGSLMRILPHDDNAAASYVSSRPSTAMLQAAMTLNGNPYRRIDIRLEVGAVSAELIHIVEMSKSDPELLYGLIQSMEISSLGAGSLVRGLLLCKGVDYEYLYLKVLPAASGGRTDRLLSLVCINPGSFVSWIGVPEPYAGALIEVLKHETQQAIWKRISGFVSRWKRPEVEGAHHS